MRVSDRFLGLMTIQSAKRTQLSYANVLIADARQTRLLT